SQWVSTDVPFIFLKPVRTERALWSVHIGTGGPTMKQKLRHQPSLAPSNAWLRLAAVPCAVLVLGGCMFDSADSSSSGLGYDEFDEGDDADGTECRGPTGETTVEFHCDSVTIESCKEL